MMVMSSTGAVAPSFSISRLNNFRQLDRKRRKQFLKDALHVNERKLVPTSSKRRSPKTTPPPYPSLKIMVKAQQTYTSEVTIVTDIPLSEAPHATFDTYMEDKPRICKAIFPKNRGTQQLNEEEWRIKMEPIGFMFLTAWPVVCVRMRCKTKAKDYPSGVPAHTTKLLHLQIIKFELEGAGEMMKSSDFKLGMEGVIYPDRHVHGSMLIRGHLHMSMSFTPPLVLAMVPPQVHQNTSLMVLKNLAESMKRELNENLLADYTKFKKEK